MIVEMDRQPIKRIRPTAVVMPRINPFHPTGTAATRSRISAGVGQSRHSRSSIFPNSSQPVPGRLPPAHAADSSFRFVIIGDLPLPHCTRHKNPQRHAEGQSTVLGSLTRRTPGSANARSSFGTRFVAARFDRSRGGASVTLKIHQDINSQPVAEWRSPLWHHINRAILARWRGVPCTILM